LPKSGQEPRDFSFFVERMSVGADILDHETATTLYLPLA
jgi:hypothetical protein